MNAKLKMLQDYPHENETTEFMNDVVVGLSRSQKQLSSKYFYDSVGSDLFNQITRHPDYYLTTCEIEILTNLKEELSNVLKNESFNLIELGPGEGIKPRLLIDQFLKDGLSFSYFTIDISKNYLTHLVHQFNQQLPELDIIAINADYLSGMKWLKEQSEKRNIVLFLGSSIGNFDLSISKRFLQNIRSSLHAGDYMLIGFDLRKDIDTLLRAYNDNDGITRAFNLNLLQRINRELQADFDVNLFSHYGTYDVYAGAMKSYLLSLSEQTVTIPPSNKMFSFEKFEPIHVESSYKFLFSQIKMLADTSQFEIIKNYTDPKEYFANSLWQARK
ncbi:Histidine-specific methyltransferase EgtD [Legionella lansingensis]|uniref:Histidine-specific methyltransferase EgtD n=2 Tax=Legionella lansingensis TaxID=45067 RepID=A0A0W0VQE1_9GAMM|nr:L-histidine N(alpha)-methyltransferase [Legionella lansingensis]KTD22321.1 Histidine-specific methyltransferase EgtD [Legionella lansingensis]SNV50749.1 Histidine-specific methyltransferase EgtD [Legionella lansingensis]